MKVLSLPIVPPIGPCPKRCGHEAGFTLIEFDNRKVEVACFGACGKFTSTKSQLDDLKLGSALLPKQDLVDTSRSKAECLWLFGRGLSFACGLTWDDLGRCPQVQHDEKIECIKRELRAAMDAPEVNTEPIGNFLRFLSERTRHGWRHCFLTTNWDFLLQREVDKFVRDAVPRWLCDSQVFHLNGTVEILDNNSRRSAFVLRDAKKRTPSVELNIALSNVVWGQTFVVLGMRFECEADKALFNILNKVQEKLPSGESTWIVVNPCQIDLDNACRLIKGKLSQSSVTPVCKGFTQWQAAGFPELKERGIFHE